MKKIFYLILIMVCAVNINAQNTSKGVLMGNVINSEKQNTLGVSILLKEISKGITTDINGNFELTEIPEGKYTLKASFVGYKTLEKKIIVTAGSATILNLELFENNETLKEIVVKGYTSPNNRIATIGKMPIKPMDLPQSITIIDKQLLQNQQVLRLSDLLMNVNGMYIMGNTGGYQEEISARGFSMGSTNTFRNGVRFFNGMITEMSGLERVEILKGGSAILFGNVSPGGVINMVSKKPKFDFGGEISYRTGSFGFHKPTFDIFGGIGKNNKMAFRLNGSYEKANSFRKGVSSERQFINPSFLFKIAKKTEVTLEADYTNDQRTPDFGTGIINYQIVKIPRQNYLGFSWNNFTANQSALSANIAHQFNSNWKLNVIAAARKYETLLISNTRPNAGTLINAEGMWVRNAQKSDVNNNYKLGQIDLTGTLNTGAISHQILIGADADEFTTNTLSFNNVIRYDTVNVFGTKQYKTRNDIPVFTKNMLTRAPVSRIGIYAQDLLNLSKYVKVLAGIRYSYQQTVSDIYTYSTQKNAVSKYYDGAFSPRIGLVVQPNVNQSIFLSYTNNFSLNTGVTVTGEALPASIIDQYEIGIKNELLKGLLSLNVTAYQITNDNLAQISLANGNTNSNIRELAGAVRSKGIEVDMATKPLAGISITAGYSYNQTKYIKSNTFIEGSLLRYNPNHTSNIGINYKPQNEKLKNLNIGLVAFYMGERFAGRSTRVQVKDDSYKLIKLNAFTQIDATASYNLKNLYIKTKVANIFDVISYNIHDDNSVNPITPRNNSLTLGYKF